MAADFWAGYISGAIGILIGNPLDLIKVRLQAGTLKPSSATAVNHSISPVTSHGALPNTTYSVGSSSPTLRASLSSSSQASATASLPTITTTNSYTSQFSTFTSLLRGSSAPILGYGALNALLFMTYNRSASLLTYGTLNPPTSTTYNDKEPTLITTFIAGALGGLATWVVSTPTELVKCRAQVANPPSAVPPNAHPSLSTVPSQSPQNTPNTSLQIARGIFRTHGIKGLYAGGIVTSLRDSIGYGFYFWSYEASTRYLSSYLHRSSTSGDDINTTTSSTEEALKVLLCGGLAGVITWASVFPLDVIKTRVQTQANLFTTLPGNNPSSACPTGVQTPLLHEIHERSVERVGRPYGSWQIAKQAYLNEGAGVFFRGLGVCSIRAFVVNAVQWAVYEWIMNELVPGRRKTA